MADNKRFAHLPVSALLPRPGLNPRTTFDAARLKELAATIEKSGVHLPLVVHDVGNGQVYHIIAGERRWRAVKLLNDPGFPVPCSIAEYSEEEMVEIALIENLQREDLNPIEEARGLKRALELPGLSQKALAERLGVSQPWISNRIRVLDLPDNILKLVEDGALEFTYARDLLLPFAKIPEAKRKNLYDTVAKKLRSSSAELRGSENDVRNVIGDVAARLSRPVGRDSIIYGIDRGVEPMFDAKLHAGTKKKPGCTCQAPAVKYGYRNSVRCFDDDWWNAAQASAKEGEQKRRQRALEKAKAAVGDAPVGVMTDDQFRKAYGDKSYSMPRLERHDVVDVELLGDASFAVVKQRHGGPEVVCTDEKAWKKAKSAVTREQNQLLKQEREKRAQKDIAEAKQLSIEPWMLAELLARRPYDQQTEEVAKEIGIELKKDKSWGAFDRAIRALGGPDVELLFKVLAVRAKRGDLGGRDTVKDRIEKRIAKKYSPAIKALRARLLEAAGVEDAAAKPGADDIAPTDEAECVQCGCMDSMACEGGCSWLVVNRDERIGVCSSCASSEEEAQQILVEALVPAA
jgi:ParB family chromosome partitioning protein